MPQLAVALPYIMFLIAVASTMYSLANRPDDPMPPPEPGDPGLKVNTRSTQEFIKIVYGLQKVGGNDVYMATTGTNNNILWMVQTLAEGECEGIYQVDGADQVWLNDSLESIFGSVLSYTFHAGTSAQTVDTDLAAAMPEWADTLRNTSYMVWKLTFDRNFYQSIPVRMVELKGRVLYDFRDASTAWSDNPVLCLYDYFTNTRYGCGIASTKIDTTSWTSAANYCDTKGWGLNIAFNSDQAAIDVINTILSHFRGTLVWYDGKYYLRYADLNVESSLMTLNDEHIAQDTNGKAAVCVTEPSEFQKPDAVRVKFIDAEKDYAIDDIMIGDDTGTIREIAFLGCTDREHASNLGVYNLERWQLDRTVSGTFRGDALQLEPHDVVTFSSTALSISGQLMRVREANILPDQLIELTLAYEDVDLYDDNYDLDVDATYTCTLPDPMDQPPAVVNATLTEETYNYRLRSFTKLKVTFDPPSNYAWFDHVEVWLSYDNSTWNHMFDSTSDFELANVEEKRTYYLRLKSVSIWGVKQDDDDDRTLSTLVAGYVTPPESVTALHAIVTQGGVNLYADKLSDSDIEFYEFRLGTTWSGGVFLAALHAPNLSLSGVKPGEHTFLVNTLSNNGIYGDTARTATASIQDPPDGWTVDAGLTKTCSYPEAGFTMKARQASVAITGYAARLTRVMIAAQGSVAISGQDATLSKP